MQSPARARLSRPSFMQLGLALLSATALGIAACGGGGGGSGDGTIGNEPPLDVSQGPSALGSATVLGAALNAPWGLAFLPDGRMLVTERGGSMALVSADGGTLTRFTSGVPAVASNDQGGLLDVAYRDGSIYFTYSEPGDGGSAGTALARAQLNGAGNGLQNVTVLWRQTPKVVGDIHFGSRIAFRDDGTLYLAVGERGVEGNFGTARTDATGVQVTTNTIGKVLRLNADNGSAPGDNPSFGAGAAAGLWSIGHRNPQGAAVRPGTNELWISEHGPQAGDEVNRVSAGANFGWPVRSYGCDYAAPSGPSCLINGGTHAPNFTEPKVIWTPATAPSGLMFYNGSAFPEWEGNLFSGALNGATLWRIVVDGSGKATSRQEISAVKSLGVRIRDVRQGPDGNIYLLTNGGGGNGNRIVRLAR